MSPHVNVLEVIARDKVIADLKARLASVEEERDQARARLAEVGKLADDFGEGLKKWKAQAEAAEAKLAEVEAERDAAQELAAQRQADIWDATAEVERLRAGHGERAVCDHRDGAGACPDCYGWARREVLRLTHREGAANVLIAEMHRLARTGGLVWRKDLERLEHLLAAWREGVQP